MRKVSPKEAFQTSGLRKTIKNIKQLNFTSFFRLQYNKYLRT